MSSPTANGTTGVRRPHLVSLVLQSKKSLQHGEQLCTRASALSSESAQVAMDVLALDAKVRWMTDSVLEQLKLAASVAKSIEIKRSQLEKRAQEWDVIRNQRTDALDTILESLGKQVVPPDFHSGSSASSIFGSQHGSGDEGDNGTPFSEPHPNRSPTETLRNVLINGVSKKRKSRNTDRSRWKNLRDFVDERAVEEVLDMIESDRNSLDDILARTSDYPESLHNTISAIQNTIPTNVSPPSIQDIFTTQAIVSEEMARHLEALANHYEQMSSALRDSEAGEMFSDSDIQEMNRDTEELPSVIRDLESNVTSIESSHGQLVTAKKQAQDHLETLRSTLDDLEELGDILSEMLERQQVVEDESTEHLTHLHHSLVTVEDLYHRFTSYEYSFSKLLVELSRRRQYKEAAEKIVKGMLSQLDAMAEEERIRREEFNAEHGDHLPSDVCLSIQNPPTRWDVLPWNNETAEVLPSIDSDLLSAALARVARAEGALGNSQSL